MTRCCTSSFRYLLLLAAIATGAAAGPSPAGAGTVWTQDGKSYEGRVTLNGSGQLSFLSDDGHQTNVDLASVVYASINPPSAIAEANDYLGPLASHLIGPTAAGDAVFSRDLYVIKGTAAGLGGAADDFQFVSEGVFGDVEITARPGDLTDPSASAGIMLRESLKPDARCVSITVNGAGELSLRSRGENGAAAAVHNLGKVALPIFLRISRTGNDARVSQSSDGANWTPLNGAAAEGARSPRITVAMGRGASAGLVFGGGTKSPGHASFDHVSIVPENADNAKQAAPPPRPALFRPLPQQAMMPGALFTRGTFLAGAKLVPSPPSGWNVQWQGKAWPTELAQVARFQRDPLSATVLSRIPLSNGNGRTLSGGAGVLMTSGDFLAGAIQDCNAEQVTVNNIVLGLSNIPAARTTAVVLRGVETPASGYRVQLLDGSVLVASTAEASTTGELQLTDAVLGRTAVPIKQIVSVQRVSGVITVLDLPCEVDGPPNTMTEAMTCFSRDSGLWLRTGGQMLERGLVAPAGTSITFKPPRGSHLLRATLAVPELLSHEPQLQFVVTADGKEIFRSPAMTSRDAARTIALDVTDAAAISMRIELANKSDLPAFGLIANPLLTSGNTAP